MGKVVGIDLGTTNSVIAVLEGGEPVVIPTAEGGRLCPSVVGFTKTGERLVGAPAKRQAVVNPENTIFSIKRFIGRRYDEVEEERKRVPYKVVADSKGDAAVQIPALDKTLRPEEISAMVLQKLKADAEAYLGEKVDAAVITVPAYFNDAQRTATKNAGEIAGLKVLRIINEPTAAALAYGLDKKSNETILVFDLGGGTFDVSILEVGDGVFEVKSTSGDTHLGGDDFDQRIVDYLADEFKKEHGIDLRQDRQALQRLKEAAERAKIELSTVTTTTINLPFITADASGPKHLDMTLTRAKFEDLCADLFERLKGPIFRALEDAGLKPSDVDEVVLVGGSTRIPKVQEMVRQITGKEPHKGVNPDEVVAIGAAIQAGVLSGEVKDIVLLDVTPLSLGIETKGGIFTVLIPRNTTIPASATEVFTTSVDGQRNVLIHVVQGERELAKDCRSLARFDLKDIEPLPAGMARIEVRFLIDANGILSVTARDLRSGKEQTVEVKPSYGLTEEQVEAMIRESYEKAEEDLRERQVREARVEADNILAAVEKARSSDAWLELTDEERAAIDAAINELQMVYHSGDHLLIRDRIGKLDNATRKLAETMMNTAVREALKGTKID